MAAPINVPLNGNLQNGTQLTQQIQTAFNRARINIGGARGLQSLSQPLGRLTGQADEFTKSLDAANARVLAFGASVGIVNTVSNAFKALVNSTIEVEKAITEISVVGEKFAGQSKELSRGLFDIAKNTGQAFNEVSKAALEFARQGLPLEQTLARTKDALILTRTTGLDAAKSVEGLSAAVSAFAKAGLSTAQVINKLAAVDQAFKVSSADLIQAFERTGAVAQQAGVSFDELAGIVTALQSDTSRGGAVIGNALKTIFSRLRDQTVLDQLDSLGIAVEDVNKKVLPARQILQNLANDVQKLDEVTKAGVFKDVAGTFQLNQLVSLVNDLSNARSVSAKATEVSTNATNEAYVANEKLNQSLDAILNKVAVTGKQLGALLGEIGFSDNLKGILNGINSFLETVTDVLQGNDLGSKFAKGIVKGIGSVLSGPGLGVFLAIVAKLSYDLLRFGAQSLKTFFGIGKAANDQKQIQESIVQVLLRNQNVLNKILSTQGGQNAQALAFLGILNQQAAAMQTIQGLAGNIAGTVYGAGYRQTGQGLTRRSAGGYLPAQEAADVRRGVGGASPNSKVVAIPNFAFGGGKRGTMIANTSEYIVPNYAGGGSAIFNQDMVKTMGLPAGAKKISAAGGFIPNFALVKDIAKYNPRIALNLKKSNLTDGRLSPFDIVNLTGNKFNQKNIPLIQGESATSYENRVIRQFGYKSNDLLKYQGSSAVDGYRIQGNQIDLLEVKSGAWNSYDVLNKFLRAIPENYGTNNVLDLWTNNKDSFSVKSTLISPQNKNFKATQSKLFKNSSEGYIPNFANYIYDADRIPSAQRQQILQSILDSVKRKNLLVGPAGSGKSTAAAGLGTFIKSLDDLRMASSFTILSASGLSKKTGGLTEGFQNILNAVNSSGGKVTYLGVTNEELMRRRGSRTLSEGDLRSAGQLSGTAYAPLNQSAFIKQLKKESRDFQLQKSAKSSFSNDQLAILGLYGQTGGNIDGSKIYTLSSQQPNITRDIKKEYKARVKTFVRSYSQELANKIGIKRSPKEVKKSIQQSDSISGFIFEDVLNQLAGKEFDTASLSGGARVDFKMTPNLKTIFGTGSEIYAEAKLNPYTDDARSSVLSKQAAMLSGAASLSTRQSSDSFSKLRQRWINYKNRANKKSGYEEFLAILKAAGFTGTNKDTQNKQLDRYFGTAAAGYIPNFADLDGDGVVTQRDGFYQRLKSAAKKYSKNPAVDFILNQVLQSMLGLPEGVDVMETVKACDKALKALKPEDELNKILREKSAAKKAQKRQSFLKGYYNSSSGYIPNFAASALQDAIAREKSAGLSDAQIYIDQNPSLKSPQNPMGLMVANTRDEPFGGIQGISRARRQGMNPKLYGAANGFVPNYANPTAQQQFQTELQKLVEAIKNGTKTQAEANQELTKIVKNITNTRGRTINQRTQDRLLKQGQAEIAATTKVEKGFADLGGKIIAAQTALSFFQGAASAAGGETERLANTLSTTVATIAQLGFLLSGTKLGNKIAASFSTLFSGIGSKIGIGGGAGAGAGLLGGIGRAAGGIGRAAGPIGAALTAGFVISQAVGAFKEFTRGDVSKSLDSLSNAASEAAASLTDQTRAESIAAKKKTNEGFNLGTAFLETITFGQIDLENKGGKIFKDERLIDEEFSKIYDEILTSFVAAGLKTDEAIQKTNELLASRSDTGGQERKIGGVTRTNLTSEQEQKRIKVQLKLNSILAQSKAAEEAYALALATSSKETKNTIDLIAINAEALQRLNEQYNKIEDSILNLELGNNFQKFSNKTLVELNNNLSQAEKNVKEFESAISGAKLDLNLDLTKASGGELKKINAKIAEEAKKVGRAITEEQLGGVSSIQAAFAEATMSFEEFQSVVQKADVAALLNTKELLDQYETYKRQTDERKRQASIQEQQIKLDFINKTLNDQNTLILEKQNSILEKRLNLIEREFDFKKRSTDLDRQISDTRFETGLIGKSRTETLTAQRGRVAETQRRANEDVIRELQQQLVNSIKEIEIPTTLSPEAQQNLKAQRNAVISGILQQPAGANPQEQVNNLTKMGGGLATGLIATIADQEQKMSDYAFDQTIEAAKGFADIVTAAARDISLSLVTTNSSQGKALLEALNKAKKDLSEAEADPKDKNLSSLRALVQSAQEDLDAYLNKFSLSIPNTATEQAKANAKAITDKIRADREAINAVNAAVSAEQQKTAAQQAGTQAAQELQLNQAEANKGIKEFTQSLLEIGDVFTNLKILVRDFVEGLPRELANLQFNALQSVNPNDLASNLIKQQVIQQSTSLNPLGVLGSPEDQAKQTQFIAEQTALREKGFELATAEGAVRRFELEFELKYLEKFLELKKEGASVEKLAALERQKIAEKRTFGYGLDKGLSTVQERIDNYRTTLGEEIPNLFSQNLAQGLNDAISGAKTLKEALMDAATSFFQEMTRKNISNLADLATKGLGSLAQTGLGALGGFFQPNGAKAIPVYASGGFIKGGSGTKDDVPAMLMGGEYVVNKSAVNKYGKGFFDAINGGRIRGYAAGGMVDPQTFPTQTGRGGFFTPGDYGQGAITGKNELLTFATQSFTGGQYDYMGGFGMGGATVSLEPESARLSALGREDSPMFERVQQSKDEAFRVYLDGLQKEKEYAELLDQIAKDKKARKKQLQMAIISAVVSSAASYAGSAMIAGAQNATAAAAKTAAASGQTLSAGAKFMAGFKGMFTGAGGQGGLANIFKGTGTQLSDLVIANQNAKMMESLRKTGLFGSGVQGAAKTKGMLNTQDNAVIAKKLAEIYSQVGVGTKGVGKATAYGNANIDPTTKREIEKGIIQEKWQYLSNTGAKLTAGKSIASNVFKTGTVLEINGKKYLVQDTGGMGPNVLDFYSGSNKNMYQNFAGMGQAPFTIKSGGLRSQKALMRVFGGDMNKFLSFYRMFQGRNSGGLVAGGSSISDDVPAMLTGGEFVLNNRATQRIGLQNLNKLNSGAPVSSEGASAEMTQALMSKLDELIQVTENSSQSNVVVNVSSTDQEEQNPADVKERDRELQKKIRQAVLDVIAQEKRLGGSLEKAK